MEQFKVIGIILLAAAVLLVVIAGPIIYLLRRSRRYQAYVRDNRDARVEAERIHAAYADAGMQVNAPRFMGGAAVTGTLHEAAFSHRILPGGRNTPPRAVIEWASDFPGEFAVRREGRPDRVFKAIGLAGEAQTGDPAFDREFYLLGPSRNLVKAVFADASNRAAVRQLFELGFDRVELRGGLLSAMRRNRSYLIELDVVRSAIGQFASLQAPPGAAQLARQGGGLIGTRQIQAGTIAVLAVAMSLFALSALLLEPLVDGQFAMYAGTWRTALSVYIPVALLAFLTLRGRSAAALEFALVGFVVLPGLWVGGVSGAMIGNQFLDRSMPRTVQTELLRKYTSRSRDKTTYHLVFRPWRDGQEDVRVPVSATLYERAGKKQRWTLQVRAGRFGYAWIESMAPVPADSSA